VHYCNLAITLMDETTICSVATSLVLTVPQSSPVSIDAPANHHFTLQLTPVKSSWIMNEQTVIVFPTAECLKVKPHCGHRLSLNITTKQPESFYRQISLRTDWQRHSISSVCFHRRVRIYEVKTWYGELVWWVCLKVSVKLLRLQVIQLFFFKTVSYIKM